MESIKLKEVKSFVKFFLKKKLILVQKECWLAKCGEYKILKLVFLTDRLKGDSRH